MPFLLEFSGEALRPNERLSIWGENSVEAVSFGIALVYPLNASPAAIVFVCFGLFRVHSIPISIGCACLIFAFGASGFVT